MAHILVTGAAGFVGAAVSEKLLQQGHSVVGVDNLNDYYTPVLKKARLNRLIPHEKFVFSQTDIADLPAMQALFQIHQPSFVVHLAAQAGVRYSLTHPHTYAQSNMVGHLNVLECCRALGEKLSHLVYASSSSVYGGNTKVPFEETDVVDNPQSLYAASKRADELMSHTYAHLFKLPSTGLRFFTVYGPWGRPDMSPWLFASNILDNKPVAVFNHGDLWRDFTYIDDIVEGVVRLTFHPPQHHSLPHEVFNIGNQNPVKLIDYIHILEEVLDKKAVLDLQPWPPTEVYKTYASTEKLKQAVGYQPKTDLHDGLKEFATWLLWWRQQK